MLSFTNLLLAEFVIRYESGINLLIEFWTTKPKNLFPKTLLKHSCFGAF